jgi:hypothetical protein
MAPKVMKAVAKAKAKAKARTAIIDALGLPVANFTPRQFSVFCQSRDGAWCIIKTHDLDAQSFVFNWLQIEFGIGRHDAAGAVRDFYLASVGGKRIPNGAVLCETIDHMSHVIVVRRNRGGMEDRYILWKS